MSLVEGDQYRGTLSMLNAQPFVQWAMQQPAYRMNAEEPLFRYGDLLVQYRSDVHVLMS